MAIRSVKATMVDGATVLDAEAPRETVSVLDPLSHTAAARVTLPQAWLVPEAVPKAATRATVGFTSIPEPNACANAEFGVKVTEKDVRPASVPVVEN